jgi:hypothetical protein
LCLLHHRCCFVHCWFAADRSVWNRTTSEQYCDRRMTIVNGMYVKVVVTGRCWSSVVCDAQVAAALTRQQRRIGSLDTASRVRVSKMMMVVCGLSKDCRRVQPWLNTTTTLYVPLMLSVEM